MGSVVSRLTAFRAALAAGAAMVGLSAVGAPVLYDNGAVTGMSATGISSGVEISSAFVLSQPGTAASAAFGYWLPTGVSPTTVDWKIGTAFFDGSIASGSTIGSTLLQTGIFSGRFDLYNVTFDFPDVALDAGTYFLTLTTTQPVRASWDLAGGVGGNVQLRGPNFQAEAYGGRYAFQIIGADAVINAVPEPTSLSLCAGALLGVAVVTRRGRRRSLSA